MLGLKKTFLQSKIFWLIKFLENGKKIKLFGGWKRMEFTQSNLVMSSWHRIGNLMR